MRGLLIVLTVLLLSVTIYLSVTIWLLSLSQSRLKKVKFEEKP